MKKLTLSIAFLFTTTIISGLAVADTLAKDKKRLENLQVELEQKKEALQKQKAAVKAMEKKLECNYNLLQSYNQCEEKHQKDSDEYVSVPHPKQIAISPGLCLAWSLFVL